MKKFNLTEEGKTNFSDNGELVRIFIIYLSEIISKWEIPSLINNSAVDSNAIRNALSIAIKRFDQHPSISNLEKKNFDSALIHHYSLILS